MAGTSSRSPVSYGFSPIKKMPGSLESSYAETGSGIEKNFNLVQASIRQIIDFLLKVNAAIPDGLAARLQAVESWQRASYLPKITVFHEFTGNGQNYEVPSLFVNLVVFDAGSFTGCTVTLPAAESTPDAHEIAIKCSGASGPVAVSGDVGIAIGSGSVASVDIPESNVADGATFTRYSCVFSLSKATGLWEVKSEAFELS